MTSRRIIPAMAIAVFLLALVVAACSPEQRAALRMAAGIAGATAPPVSAVAQPVTPVTAAATTPEFSLLATPTPPPTMGGPMGTLTAIADLVASPTQDAEPYVIQRRGNPHFIEFHAWW